MSTWPSSRNKPSATMVSPSIASITLLQYISVCFCVFIFFLFMRRRDFLWGLFPGLLDFRYSRGFVVRARGFFLIFF